MATGEKAPDAFRTISELSTELGVAQHILRYWESKFPQLRPLQRAGNRRYYRPADVALARRIHRLLNQEGYTVRGVQQLLAAKDGGKSQISATASPVQPMALASAPAVVAAPAESAQHGGVEVDRLIVLRDRLAAALAE
jgi:DNA-binding transcriptional MerR regulator